MMQPIRALVYREGEHWIAQCLEHDICAQARTEADVRYELERLLVGYVVLGFEEGRDPFERIPPAPARFFRLWERATPRGSTDPGTFTVPDGGPPPPVIDLRAA